MDNVTLLHANDAAVASRHADIRDVGGAFVQDALVSRLHVSVGAIDD